MVSENCMFIKKLKTRVRIEELNKILEKSIWIEETESLVKRMPELRQFIREEIKRNEGELV